MNITLNRLSRLAAILFGYCGAISSAAAADTCPPLAHLSGASVAAADIPAGFAGSVGAGPLRLSGVSAYDGPPEDGAALQPAHARAKGGVIIWKFEGDYPKGKWVSCDYAEGLVRISRRVADAAASCTAATRVQKPQGTLEASISCK